MNTSIDTPASARHLDGHIVVTMSSGFEFTFPCSDYPRLAAASSVQRSQMELSPFGIHWSEIDEDLSIAGLLREHAKR